jgi:hypothetical protein
VAAVGDCADPDGRVTGFAWQVDGRNVPTGSNRILLTPEKAGRVASTVTLVATDDGGMPSAPVSVSVEY